MKDQIRQIAVSEEAKRFLEPALSPKAESRRFFYTVLLRFFGLKPAFLLSLGLLFGLGFFSACSFWEGAPASERSYVGILSWNLQNLFDPVEEGSEYDEFKNGAWTWEAYSWRIQNLAQALAEILDNDISLDSQNFALQPAFLCFQELENERVVKDLLEALQEKYSRASTYVWAGASPASGSSLGLGLISRYRPRSQRVHRVWASSPLRYVWELSFEIPCLNNESGQNSGETVPLVLFVNHWKSRLGGIKETEEARRLAAWIIRRRTQELSAQDPDCLFVSAGDFNCEGLPGEAEDEAQALYAGSPDESGKEAGLYLVGEGDFEQNLLAYGQDEEKFWLDPWLERPDLKGSYYLDDSWERIDHILYHYTGAGQFLLACKYFATADFEGQRNTNGSPRRFVLKTLQGYSDHVPVLAWMQVRKKNNKTAD